jgi:hypothetical protein
VAFALYYVRYRLAEILAPDGWALMPVRATKRPEPDEPPQPRETHIYIG